MATPYPLVRTKDPTLAVGGALVYNVRGILACSPGDVDFNNTVYDAPCAGTGGGAAAEVQFCLPIAGRIYNLYVYIAANTLDGNCVITFRVNGAASALALTIGAGVTGVQSETATIVTTAAYDDVGFEIDTTAATVGTISINSISCIFESTADGATDTKSYSCLVNSQVTATSRPAGVTQYSIPFGRWLPISQGTERFLVLPFACTAEQLFVQVEPNSLDGNAVITVRREGANTAITLTIAAGDTGFFSDEVNTQAFAEGERIGFQLDTTAAGSGNIVIHSVSCVVED